MKRVKSYTSVQRRWYRPAERECAVCHRPLRQAMTLSRRTVVTLQAVIKLIHAGYRCPDRSCLGRSRIYRSAEADALALPGFTYGLDIVVLVGQLHLGKHQTLDEVHHEVQERLRALAVSISRREILYLFDAYCALLRASSEAKDDKDWLGQVKENGGIIVSVDGIQPDRGNETIYLVRDELTGRVLVAENALSSETEVIPSVAHADHDAGNQGVGDDHRCARERTAGGRAALAGCASPGVPVPCLARGLSSCF